MITPLHSVYSRSWKHVEEIGRMSPLSSSQRLSYVLTSVSLQAEGLPHSISLGPRSYPDKSPGKTTCVVIVSFFVLYTDDISEES